MKILIGFIIGFVAWFAFAWLPQYIRVWINCIRFNIAKKKAKPCDKWMFEI